MVFSGCWPSNDTRHGGQTATGVAGWGPRGLVLEAEVVEQGGGLCELVAQPLSPLPWDLGAYRALEFELRGDGRRYKLAVACAVPTGCRPDRA